MSQLSLFDEPEEEHKIDIVYVPHHKSTGLGNFYDFLQYYRNENNTFAAISVSIQDGYRFNGKKRIPIFRIVTSKYLISQVNELDVAKRLLFKFNSDTKEWERKPINNFRINEMLYTIYEQLIERSNHV
jgi:hypothetical protein